MINIHKNVEHEQKKAKIHIKPSEEGSLHREMGVPEGKKIGRGAEERKLATAKKNHDVSLERKIVFALNFGKKK